MLYDELAKIQFSKQLYISGMRALNINDYEFLTGDWHVHETWHPDSNLSSFHIMGEGKIALFDTNVYLGEEGVFEASEILRTMGIPIFSPTVFAATHARAIADKIIAEAFLAIELNGSKLFRYISLHDFDDYMPEDTDKQRVYELLEKAIKLLPQEQSDHVKEWLYQAKCKFENLTLEQKKIRSAWLSAQANARQAFPEEVVNACRKNSNSRLRRILNGEKTVEEEESELLRKWQELNK